MLPTKNMKARAARDRLIDLLRIGETYPLRDVTLPKTQLTVLYNTPLEVTIDPSQGGVTYTLCEGYVPLASGTVQEDVGASSVLKGPAITKDRTFQILASKQAGPDAKVREAFLHQEVTVKVGLDTAIRAWIHDAPPLTPDIYAPKDTDARIIDYGGAVEVRIADTQVGADYSLFFAVPGGAEVSTPPKPGVGSGAELSLFTPPIFEDTSIRILASRNFDNSGGLEDLSEPLDAVLPLAVRANPDVTVSVVGSPVVDPEVPVKLTIDNSQTSVSYTVFVRRLLDVDFAGSDTSGAEAIAVPASLDVPEHTVLVRSPARISPWKVQNGFAPVGPAMQGKGSAGPLEIPLGLFHDDSVFVVRAHKDHSAPKPGTSAVQLKEAAVALTRPDPAPDLALSPHEDNASGELLVTGGQPGVFYHFRAGATELGLPAYFHERDEGNAQLNKGVGQLKVEVNLVVVRDAPSGDASDDPAQLYPPPPVVELAPLPPDGIVSVSAVKARTGVAWATSREMKVVFEP
jgi:hypothetical protein